MNIDSKTSSYNNNNNNNNNNVESIGINSWILLNFYIDEALRQAERLINALYNANDSKEVAFNAELEPEEIIIYNQFFQKLGVMIGFGMRCGVCVQAMLPPSFTKVLITPLNLISTNSNTNVIDMQRENVMNSQDQLFALCFRKGVTSLLPEHVLELLNQSDIDHLIHDNNSKDLVMWLRRIASYEKGIKKSDLHITLFWAIMLELPRSSVMTMLSKLPKEALLRTEDVNRKPMRILPPTALAMLSPESADIVVIPESCSISIPKVITLHAMRIKIDALINTRDLN
jgi:hypothetical protein